MRQLGENEMKPNCRMPQNVRLSEWLARSAGIAERLCMCHNATTLVALWCTNMPTTLTLKNIPDAVYERLKSAAEMHRRSLNSEAIVCLEAVLLPTKLAPSERLARARELRAALPKQRFVHDDVDAAKREGRA
jgi:antitoxin FitA